MNKLLLLLLPLFISCSQSQFVGTWNSTSTTSAGYPNCVFIIKPDGTAYRNSESYANKSIKFTWEKINNYQIFMNYGSDNGITFTINSNNDAETECYPNNHQKFIKQQN